MMIKFPFWPPYHPKREVHSVVLMVLVERKGKHRWCDTWNRQFYQLQPNKRIHIMTDVVVGHEIVNTIVYLDQNGQPMLVTPAPDSAPVWTNLAAPTIDTMSVSADGSTDTVTAVGAGVDSLTVTVTVGGVQFTAVEQISVSAAPQVLTSVAINSVVQ
jgi:hypothetical protein